MGCVNDANPCSNCRYEIHDKLDQIQGNQIQRFRKLDLINYWTIESRQLPTISWPNYHKTLWTSLEFLNATIIQFLISLELVQWRTSWKQDALQ